MNKWSELTEALSQLPVFDSVNATKKQLDDIRPLPQEVEGRVMQKLRLEWNYHSNAIEGNKLTYGETNTFLMEGLTAKGKPLKDHLDIKGHNEAINFLTSLIKDERDLTEGDVRDLHKKILVEPYQSAAQTPDGKETTKIIRIGEYKQQSNHVKTLTGEIHYYATPEDVPIKMHELMQWYNEARHNKNIHPSVLAAFVHHRFVAIHPFDDGNGRLARILMNLIMMKNGYPPAIIKLKERTDYYAALNQADKNEYVPIIEFVAEAVSESMNLYLKAAKGESIEDDGDLDKEIALFKVGLGKSFTRKKPEVILSVFNNFILPIHDNAERGLGAFDELFRERTSFFDFRYREITGLNAYDVSYEFKKLQGMPYDKIREAILKDEIEDNIYVSYHWSDFVKSQSSFSFSTNIYFEFFIDRVNITFEDHTYISKYYDEILQYNDSEVRNIVNYWIKTTFSKLKKDSKKWLE